MTTAKLVSARECMEYGYSQFRAESGRCLTFMLSIEVTILVAAISTSFMITALAQLITQLDSAPPDTFWYIFFISYAILRCSVQVLVNKWLLLLSEGRVISRDELLGFDFGYHFGAMLKMLAASMVFNFFTAVGTIFFIIPGVYSISTLRFYKFLIVDRDADAVQGLRESYEICGDSKGELISLSVICLFMKAIGLLCLGVGFLPVNAICGLAEAHAYKKLLQGYEADHTVVFNAVNN